jgi:hypothetical protein
MTMPNGGNGGGAWTVDTLRVYLNAQLTEVRSEITALRREVDTSTEATAKIRDALLAQVGARFDALNATVGRVERVVDQRFELVNQFRNQLTAESRGLMPREEIEAAIGGLTTGLEDVSARMTAAEGRAVGASTLWAHIVGGIGLILAIVAAVLAYSNNQKIQEQEQQQTRPVVSIVQPADPVRTASYVGW